MAEYEITQSEVDGRDVAVINGMTDDEWVCVEPAMLMNAGDCA